MDNRGRPTIDLTRENWDTWDPMLISEGLFAAANIFSNLKLVYIFSVNPYLGPLQVTDTFFLTIQKALNSIIPMSYRLCLAIISKEFFLSF